MTIGQHDRVSLREVENLRKSCREEAAAARKERQLKHGYRRNCESLKSTLDDKLDEIESLRSALDSANATIREMMGEPEPVECRPGDVGYNEDGTLFMEAAAASAGRIT